MNLPFYPRFAWTGIVKNRRLYIPFILICVLNSSMYYMMTSLLYHSDLLKNRGGDSLKAMLEMGSGVVFFFSAIFIFYANSFLIKQRSREIGLYSVLGMGKRNIAGVLFFEFLITSVGSVFAGLVVGIALSRLVYMFLGKLIGFNTVFHFEISGQAILHTSSVFLCILFASFVIHLFRISISRPVELVSGSSVGEKEPKTKWIMAILGTILLTAGYVIANTQEKPLAALEVFYFAVLLVMVGTYWLFIAGSIVVLKFLRKRKSFYYRSENFTSISGLIYRMKQNAVGLASICILSTMALLTISTTVSMYLGVDDAYKTRYANDVTMNYSGLRDNKVQELIDTVHQMAEDRVLTIENESIVKFVDGMGSIKDGHVDIALRNGQGIVVMLFPNPAQEDKVESDPNQSNLLEMSFLTILDNASYNQSKHVNVPLESGEILLFTTKGYDQDSLEIGSKQFQVKRVEGLVGFNEELSITDSMTIVFADSDFEQIVVDQNLGEARNLNLSFDIQGDKEASIELCSAIQNKLTHEPIPELIVDPANTNLLVESAQAEKVPFYSLHGGLLFLGIFLGLIFLLGTVMIIYYKQISEGYTDRDRFEVMRKVGMGDREIKKTIQKQILLVFFLPLATTFLHMAFAFKFMRQILNVMNFYNQNLFLIATLVCSAIFALMYGVVYSLTARTYYRIIR